jgi:hypothetical protein
VRRWLVLAAVLALLAPGVASGETCTSLSSFRWTLVGTTVPATQWGGCTPTLDDTFLVASGHYVKVDGNVTLNATGSITVQSGGIFEHASGTLVPGDFLAISRGATWIWEGRRLATGELIAEPDWTSADPIITVNIPASSVAVDTDTLVYLGEEPLNGDWSREVLNVGPGRIPGARNLALNRYARYDITNITGNVITYDLSSGTHPASPDLPYAGTRGLPTTTIIAPGDLTSMTRQPGGRATEIAVAAAFGSVVALNADLGSLFWYYPEAQTDPNNPAYCAGDITKILHSENGGAGDDLIQTIADVTGCTLGSAFITPGARRGDKIALVRPAIIDGAIGGTNTSHIRIESGSTIRVRNARFINLGAMLLTEVTPNLNRHCNICLYQSAGGPAEPITGWFVDSEIAFFEAAPGGQDSAVFSMQSKDGATSVPNAELRFPNAGQLDLSQLTQARNHIHDARNTAAAAGSHLWYVDGARGACIYGLRGERSSDDLVGGNITGNITGTATSAGVASICMRDALLYEGISERDTGQQGLEFQVFSQAEAGGVHAFARHAGFFRGKDIVVIGTYKAPVSMFGLGMLLDRVVSGGHQFSNDTVSRPFNIALTTAASPLVLHESAPNIVDNSIIAEYAEDGASAVQDSSWLAYVKNTVVFGKEQNQDADDTIEALQGCEGSFFYHAGLTSYMIEGNGSTDYIGAPSRTFRNCTFVSEDADRLGQNFTNSSRAYTVTVDRVAVYATGAFSDPGVGTSSGCLGPMANETGGVLAANGVYCATDTAGTLDFNVANAGGSVANICYESNDSPADDFDALVSATTVTKPDLLPDAAADVTVGNVVASPAVPGDTDTCERAKPIEQGIKVLGSAHVTMGSIFLKQMYPTFTSRTDLVTLVGDDTIVAPSGIYPGTIAK